MRRRRRIPFDHSVNIRIKHELINAPREIPNVVSRGYKELECYIRKFKNHLK